ITDLAHSDADPDTVAYRLRDHARIHAGVLPPDGQALVASGTSADGPAPLGSRVRAEHALGMLPEPCAGDVFFDFEGDPLWQGEQGTWGIECLFGALEGPVGDAAPVFRPFWAHSRAQEAQALDQFLAYVTQ